jgi:hypothetical protein
MQRSARKRDSVAPVYHRNASHSKAADESKGEVDRPGESVSMSVNVQSENEPKQQDRPPTSDIETKKNSLESWLRAQLGLDFPCKKIIEAHLVDKFHSRALVQKRIRWEIGIFITYVLFLVFYSFAACVTNTKGKQLVRSLVGPAVNDFSSVKSIGSAHIHTRKEGSESS